MIERQQRGKLVEWIVEIAILLLVFVVLEPSLKDRSGVSVLLVTTLFVGALVVWGPKSKWTRRVLAGLLILLSIILAKYWLHSDDKRSALSASDERNQDGSSAQQDRATSTRPTIPTSGADDQGSTQSTPRATPKSIARPSAGDASQRNGVDSNATVPNRSLNRVRAGHAVEVDQIRVEDNGRVQVGNVSGAGSPDVGIGAVRAGSNADISVGNKTQ